MKKLQSCKRHILIILGFILGFILQQTGISFQCFVLHRHAALRARGRVVCETSARNPQRPWQKYRVSLRSWRHLGLRSNPFQIPVDSEDLNGFGTLNRVQFEIWIDWFESQCHLLVAHGSGAGHSSFTGALFFLGLLLGLQ